MKVPPCFDDTETRRMIRKLCEQHRIDDDLLKDLCEIVIEHSGSGKRFGVDEQIASVLSRFIERSKEA